MASVFPKKIVSKTTGKTTIKWYVGYYQNGRHRSKSAGPSKTVALKLKQRIEAKLETRKFDFLTQPENVLIDSSIKKFLEHTKSLRKPRTYVRYKNSLDHLLEFLRKVYPSITIVGKLAPSYFSEYQAWRRSTTVTPNGNQGCLKSKPPTFKTINVEQSIFRTWLNWAIQQGQIQENPLKGLKKLKTTDSKPRKVLTREEFERLLTISEKIEKLNSNKRGQSILWRFLVNTGLRIDELSHLQWNDIDFRRGVIRVQRKSFWDPKTYEREIPFTLESEDILRELHAEKPKKNEFIFCGKRGKRFRETVVRRWLLVCAKEAEIDGMRGPHDLRHTFITWGLTEFRIDLPTMQKIAGHRNLETTQIYVHPTTSHMKSVMKQFGS